MDLSSMKLIKITLKIVKAAGKLLLLIVIMFFLALKKAAEKAALTALRCGETFTPTIKQSFFASLSYYLTTHTETLPEDIAKYYEPNNPLYSGDAGHTEVKALGLLRENEHPDGILSKPCPVCGYKYGNSWIYYPIPAEDEAIICNILKTGKLKEDCENGKA